MCEICVPVTNAVRGTHDSWKGREKNMYEKLKVLYFILVPHHLQFKCPYKIKKSKGLVLREVWKEVLYHNSIIGNQVAHCLGLKLHIHLK